MISKITLFSGLYESNPALEGLLPCDRLWSTLGNSTAKRVRLETELAFAKINGREVVISFVTRKLEQALTHRLKTGMEQGAPARSGMREGLRRARSQRDADDARNTI